MLESAIPEHLERERTQPSRAPPEGFEPPYPMYSARFPPSAKELVMAILGVQYASKGDADADADADSEGGGIAKLSSFIADPDSISSAPPFSELASVTDNRGFYNLAVLAYWPSRAAYQRWAAASGFDAWWESSEPEQQQREGKERGEGGSGRRQRGWFREIFFPTADRLETIFTDRQVPEGAAHMRSAVSGPIHEHGYWGSARDRLPIAQTDAVAGEKAHFGQDSSFSSRDAAKKEGEATTTTTTTKRCGRVRVAGKKNLAVIRSGQDWKATRPEERALYLETMHPVLTKGMDFLRDRGAEVGCYSCRFMEIAGSPYPDPDPTAQNKKAESTNGSTVTGTGTGLLDRTFGLAYFDDLASLEGWSKHHPTHLEIFGAFFRYARRLENDITLRLFHEVLVLEPEQQLFEYIGCHDGTGMLASMS